MHDNANSNRFPKHDGVLWTAARACHFFPSMVLTFIKYQLVLVSFVNYKIEYIYKSYRADGPFVFVIFIITILCDCY